MTFHELKEKHYKPNGLFRRYLMKQENLNSTEQFTYLSKLEARLDLLLDEPEVRESKNSNIIVSITNVQSLCKELKKEKINVLCGIDKEAFCEIYDIYASIAESLETTIYSCFDENSHILQRQTRLAKEPIKDHDKVRRAKDAWKKNKNKYRAAIKKFHQSSDGKAFHRNLTRFNKQRSESFTFGENDILDVSKGLSSLLTHLLIEIQLVHSNFASSRQDMVVDKVV